MRSIFLPVVLLIISTEVISIEHEDEGYIERIIDDEIEKYLEDVKQVLLRRRNETHSLTKRSTPGRIDVSKLEEAPKFSSVERLLELPDPYAIDVVLFCLEVENDETCFVAALLTSDTGKVDRLALYKLIGDKFSLSDDQPVTDGRSLATYNISGVQYIVVAENRQYSNDSRTDLNVSPVFSVNAKLETLERLHSLGDRHLNDVIIWEQPGTDHVFLATASDASAATGAATGSHVYRWMGAHFDSTHALPSNNASRIAHFSSGGAMFVAIANAGDRSPADDGGSYSAIYMYNLHEERFVLHQKLRTHGATDIKFFTLYFRDETESFLAVANGLVDSNCGVVIYKLLDSRHFLPLQCLPTRSGFHLLLPLVHRSADQQVDEHRTADQRVNEHRTADRLREASVLFVVDRLSGARAYQYDGWRFVETEVQFNGDEFGAGIVSMRAFHFNGKEVFTVVNKRWKPLIFGISWKPVDTVKTFHTSLTSWCDQVLKEEEELGILSNNFMREAQSAPKIRNSTIDIEGHLIFENPSTHVDVIEIGSVSKKPLDSKIDEDYLNKLRTDIEVFMNVSEKPDFLYFEEPVVLERFEFKCQHGCDFMDLEIGLLNGENFSAFLENAHGLSNKRLDHIEFDYLEVATETNVTRINNRPSNHLISATNPQNLFDLIVDGTVEINGHFNVNRKLDGVSLQTGLLLNETDQHFNSLNVDELIVDHLNLRDQRTKESFVRSVSKNVFTRLDVENFDLSDNTISGVDFNNFVENTLKKTGETSQIIGGKHNYKVLIAHEVDAPNFEVINSRGEVIKNDDTNIINLDKEQGIENEINFISSNTNKSFKNNDELEFSTSIYKNDCNKSDCVQPLSVINTDINIDGSMIIENGTLFVKDMNILHENVNFSDLLKEGLRIDSGRIDNNWLFTAPIQVRNLSVGTVNNIDTKSWIDVCDAKEESPVEVTGSKIFTDSLILEQGATILDHVNGIPYNSLVFDTLKKDGDQIVEGFKHIGRITAPVIESGSLFLDSYVSGAKAKSHSRSDLTVNRIKTKFLKVKLINGEDLEQIVNDTLFKDDKTYKIESNTTFSNTLNTNKLFCDDLSEFFEHSNIPRAADNYDIRPTANLSIEDVNQKILKVNHLQFTGNLDGIDANDFGHWLLAEGNQTIPGDTCVIQNLIALNGVQVTSNLINNINIDEFVEETININAPSISLSAVTFEGEVIVADDSGVMVDGLVNGRGFSEEDLVLKGADQQIVFEGEKVLESNLEVESMEVDGFDRFCRFIGGEELFEVIGDGEELFGVIGDVHFLREPKLKLVNGVNISDLKQNLWFVDEDVVIPHNFQLADAVFKGVINMSVDREMNGMNLSRLQDEYMSLTGDQKVMGDIYFGKMAADGVIVTGRVEAYNTIGGLRWDEFVSGVMRQGRRQRVSVPVHFEDVHLASTLNVNASGTINGLDLEKDVMRWSVAENRVVGKTYVNSLQTQRLEAPAGIRIQGIDLEQWRSSAVMNSGAYRVLGTKTFTGNVYVDRHLRVLGLVNGRKFDAKSILLNVGNQTIDGSNTFGSKTVLEIDDLRLNNLINGVNISDLIDRQVCSDDSNVLMVGPKTFESRVVTAGSVDMRRHFAGVDLLRLHDELTHAQKQSDRYLGHRMQVKLNSIRADVESSLARRAFLFTSWQKVSAVRGRIGLALPLIKEKEGGKEKEEKKKILGEVVFLGKFDANEKHFTMSLHSWDSKHRAFFETGERKLFTKRPMELSVVETANGEDRLYALFKSDNDTMMTGVVYKLNDVNGSLSHHSVGTFDCSVSAAKSLLYLSEDCFMLWGASVDRCSIYCSWQHVNNFPCSGVNQAKRFKDGNKTFVLLAKTTGQMEVLMFVERQLTTLVNVNVNGQSLQHLDVISQPSSPHYIVIACSESLVTYIRFDSEWNRMETVSRPLLKASARLLALPSNEVVAIVMSSCSMPSSWLWAGLSQPSVANLPVIGNEIRQAYQFTDAFRQNYTLIVSDRETAVLKANYFFDDL